MSARFNMINWLLEMISTITIILTGNYKILTILYIWFNSVCTPLVGWFNCLKSCFLNGWIVIRSTILALRKTEEQLRSISFHVWEDSKEQKIFNKFRQTWKWKNFRFKTWPKRHFYINWRLFNYHKDQLLTIGKPRNSLYNCWNE